MTEEYINSFGTLALRKVSDGDQKSDNKYRNLNVVNGKTHIIEVQSQQELDLFIEFPYEIYENNSQWPGQIDDEVKAFFDPETNVYSDYMVIQPFIAIRDGEVVGRICANINNNFNTYWNQNIGFFGFFECINDQEVANKLLSTAEEWVKSQGKDEIYGPMSPTYLEEVGFLMDSFDKAPAIGNPYNPSYYPSLVENFGFSKVRDIIQPHGDVETMELRINQKLHKIQHFLHDPNIFVRYFDRNNVERDAEIVRELLAQTFADHWGFYPADPDEWVEIITSYLPYIDEELFLIVEDSGEPIAFTLCFRDINQEMLSERLGVQFDKINRHKWDIVGVKSDYHRGGIGTFLVYSLIPGLKEHGIKEICGSWVLDDNVNSIGLCKSVGLSFDTNYRVYHKVL